MFSPRTWKKPGQASSERNDAWPSGTYVTIFFIQKKSSWYRAPAKKKKIAQKDVKEQARASKCTVHRRVCVYIYIYMCVCVFMNGCVLQCHPFTAVSFFLNYWMDFTYSHNFALFTDTVVHRRVCVCVCVCVCVSVRICGYITLLMF